jgi:DNA-binding cell septation regulator SpoVG
MIITKIKIRKVTPKDGLVGFASFVLDDSLYLGNIAVFSRLNKDTFRLVFPEKKVKDKAVSLFHPVTSVFYFQLEEAINNEFKKEVESIDKSII